MIADASPQDEALVAELGADPVVPQGVAVADRIRDQVPRGVNAVADGSLQHQLVPPAIRDGSAYVALRPAAVGGGIEPERDITIHHVMVADHIRESVMLDTLKRLTEAGGITLGVARTLPADQAADPRCQLEAAASVAASFSSSETGASRW